MTAIQPVRFRHSGYSRPTRRIFRANLGRTFGSAILLCRWSRVLGHLNETAGANARCGC